MTRLSNLGRHRSVFRTNFQSTADNDDRVACFKSRATCCYENPECTKVPDVKVSAAIDASNSRFDWISSHLSIQARLSLVCLALIIPLIWRLDCW